jgi:hypothetical protein
MDDALQPGLLYAYWAAPEVRMANILDKLHHSTNPILIWIRERFLHAFASGNLMAKMIEKEIVEECPIKDYERYR